MNEDYSHLTMPTLVDIREQNMKLHALYEEYKKSIIAFLDQDCKKLFSNKIDDIDIKTLQHSYKENNFWSIVHHSMNAHRIALIDLLKSSSLVLEDDLIYLAVQDLNDFFIRYFSFDERSYYIQYYNDVSYVQYLYIISSDQDRWLFQKDLLDCLSEYTHLFTNEMYVTFYTNICSYINEIITKEIELKQKRLIFDRESLSKRISNIQQQLQYHKEISEKILYN